MHDVNRVHGVEVPKSAQQGTQGAARTAGTTGTRLLHVCMACKVVCGLRRCNDRMLFVPSYHSSMRARLVLYLCVAGEVLCLATHLACDSLVLCVHTPLACLSHIARAMCNPCADLPTWHAIHMCCVCTWRWCSP